MTGLSRVLNVKAPKHCQECLTWALVALVVHGFTLSCNTNCVARMPVTHASHTNTVASSGDQRPSGSHSTRERTLCSVRGCQSCVRSPVQCLAADAGLQAASGCGFAVVAAVGQRGAGATRRRHRLRSGLVVLLVGMRGPPCLASDVLHALWCTCVRDHVPTLPSILPWMAHSER